MPNIDYSQFINNSVVYIANPSIYSYYHSKYILYIYTDRAKEEDEVEEVEECAKYMQDLSLTLTSTSNPPTRLPRSQPELAISIF